jgi:hypothetical protein
MNRWPVVHRLRPGHLALTLLAVAFAAPALPHETEEKVEDPGFRPESTQASAFVASFDSATIAVYPSIVRKVERTAYSYGSRELIVAALRSRTTGTTVVSNRRIDMGVLRGRSQWEWFQGGIEAVSREIDKKTPDADYSMVMEILFPPGNEYVFGVHLYVLDRHGENAFSFLLNSHHRSFVEADLVVTDSSEDARTRVIEKATQLGLAALEAQLELARASPPPAVKADYPINELPMYGHLTKTAAQKRADREYIEFMTKDGRSRSEAADIAAKAGWDFYYKGDHVTAIKRFNQAWLLDPDNQLALWGFAGICRDRDQLRDAITYFELAIEKGPDSPLLKRDYQNTLLALRQRQ